MNEPKPTASELIISLILLHDSTNILEKEPREIFFKKTKQYIHCIKYKIKN